MIKIEEIIRKRYSVRTYSSRPVEENLKKQIMEYTETLSNPFGPKVRFRLLEQGAPENGKLGTYGIIKGAGLYIGTAVPRDPCAMEALGYEMEKLVLYLTGLGLGTCWLGGTFNRTAFAEAMELQDDELFTIVSPVGYPAEKRSLIEKIMRIGSKGDSRDDWDKLFYKDSFGTPLTEEAAGEYALPLEMVRLAPSAVNRQPWRIVQKDDMFHFFEKHTREDDEPGEIDMHRIDVGIGMCHFHMTAEELGLSGHFEKADVSDIVPDGNMTYLASWMIG